MSNLGTITIPMLEYREMTRMLRHYEMSEQMNDRFNKELRALLEVPEGHSITEHAMRIMRVYHSLQYITSALNAEAGMDTDKLPSA